MTCRDLAAKLMETPDLVVCAVDMDLSEEYEIDRVTVEPVTLWDGKTWEVTTAAVVR